MLRLIVEKGDAEQSVYSLHDGELLVGRSHSASIRLVADDVSSRHVLLHVHGESVEAENLSRFGTSLEGQPFQGRIRLVPGQRIQIGRKTILRLEVGVPFAAPNDDTTNVPSSPPSGGESPLPPQEQKTHEVLPDRTAGTVPEVLSSSSPTIPRLVSGVITQAGVVAGVGAAKVSSPVGGVPPSSKVQDVCMPLTGGARNSFDQITSPGTGVGEDVSSGEPGGTHAMKTRPAGAEEIEYLRLREQQKVRRRIYMIGGTIVVALLLLFILRPPKENPNLVWDKSYEEGLVPSPMASEIKIRYPKSVGSKVKPIPGGLEVLCPLGKKQDVPLALIYQEDENEKWVAMDNATVIREWTQMVSAKDGQWIFDRANPYFIGPDNGVQFWAIPYQRQHDKIWRGMAALIRYGRRLVVVRAEIPFTEQGRAEDFLYYAYLDLPQTFVQTHWRGCNPLPSGDVKDTLRRCRTEVLRDAPATWAFVEVELTGAIAKAVVEKKPSEEKEGLALLMKLRVKLTKWFNEKKLMYLAACKQNDDGKIRELARSCQAVFQNPDDQRYFEVRKW